MDKLLGFIAIVYTLLLTIGSLIKPVSIVPSITHIDKLLHAGAYFGLAILWLSFYHLIRLRKKRKWAKARSYILIALVIIGYGIIIELLQGGLTVYRQPDTWDVLANSVGVLAGGLCFVLFFKKFKALNTQY